MLHQLSDVPDIAKLNTALPRIALKFNSALFPTVLTSMKNARTVS